MRFGTFHEIPWTARTSEICCAENLLWKAWDPSQILGRNQFPWTRSSNWCFRDRAVSWSYEAAQLFEPVFDDDYVAKSAIKRSRPARDPTGHGAKTASEHPHNLCRLRLISMRLR